MSNKLYWCPECHYKWQRWTESHKEKYEIYYKMLKFVSAELSIKKICPDCSKKKKEMGTA